MSSTDTPNDTGLISAEIGARLLMLQVPEFESLSKKWFKPETKSPARYRLVEVVQGYINSLLNEQTRGRTVAEVAAHLDLSVQRIMVLLDQGVLPRASERGGYNLDEVRRIYLRHLRAVASGHGENSGAASLASERASLARVQRDAIEWKNAINRGDYVSAGAVVRRLQETFSVQRTLLLSWVGKLPSLLEERTRAEIEAVLEQELYEVLNELADPATYVGRARAVELGLDGGAVPIDLPATAEAQPH